MKTITVVANSGIISALDVPDDVQVRVINTGDTSAPVKLANGHMATITVEPPDSVRFKSLHVNSRGPADGIPARPDIVFADEWKGWAHFFGWVPEAEHVSEDDSH
jgi:hypothetical protein